MPSDCPCCDLQLRGSERSQTERLARLAGEEMGARVSLATPGANVRRATKPEPEAERACRCAATVRLPVWLVAFMDEHGVTGKCKRCEGWTA